MLRNYLKTAIRNLLRHKGFSFINIAGLTLGLTACLLIGLFVWDENQFDRFIPDGGRVYRVYYEVTGKEGTNYIATTPPMFTTALQQFPEVEQTLRILNNPSKTLFEVGNKHLYEEGGIYAEPSFFDFFPLPFQYGSSVKALESPTSIVISQSLAHKYFKGQNPVGKEIKIDKTVFQVTGVFQNNPKFHLDINYILPLSSGVSEADLQTWMVYSYNNYVKLKKGAKVVGLESKFQKYTQPFIKDEHSTYLPRFQPLHAIHLHSSSFQYDMTQRGNITYVKALTIIALFILLIACFNFVNLATAKSLRRAKEVGIRKTIGASRWQLIRQFIGEALLLTFI
ncbi:MAG: ABC transporter permease, partial [Bacteroidota bacterium]|nr:ABC transporter permease [Bacteroidota bacterium]